MEVASCTRFFASRKETQMYYVGFFKIRGSWVPFCVVQDPGTSQKLDTICISRSYDTVHRVLQQVAEEVSGIEDTFVQYLMVAEIKNLVDRYGLQWVGEMNPGENESCGCGCGCGS